MQNETENSYQEVITKSERILLQSASSFTKSDSYGKVRPNTSKYFYTIFQVLPGFIDLFHSTADKKNAC